VDILITSASRKVSLVRAFQAALACEGGGRVIAVDVSPLAPALYFADEHYLVPSTDQPEFLEIMLRFCEQRKVKLVIPTRDEDVAFFAEHKNKFENSGTVVMVPELSTVKLCQDKALFVKFCEAEGFAVPKTYPSTTVFRDAMFPLFVKPRQGKGGKLALRVNSKTELEYVLREIPDAIVQEFVSALEYTVDFFTDFSGRAISVVPRERVYVFGGESFIGRTSRNDTLIQEAIRLGAKLHLVGHNTIQCFLEGGKVKFTEVNPRFGGGASLGFAAGSSTPVLLVKLIKGERLSPRIGEFTDTYFMLRYPEDLFLDAGSLASTVMS
jgi:carbamoyl-phosphate synthase large subunit